MKSKFIEALLAKDAMLAPRAETDVLFPVPAGSFDYRGHLDDLIRFIEREQSLDADLFAKFVRVFTEEPKLDSVNRGWRGEYWGKMMRGACITYAYTQNPALLKVLTDTARDMVEAAEEDGRISSYDRETELDGWDMWCRKYVLLGLEYFLPYCEDTALAARILETLRGAADYILAHVGPAEEGKKHITKTARIWAGMASSSMLEPIMRLYFLTKEQKYLDFATYIVESGGNDLENTFEKNLEDTLPLCKYEVVKAYEIMSCFEGLIEYYRATGEEKWKTSAINFARRVNAEEFTLIGTLGCWHELFDHAVTRQLTTDYADVMLETCVTVTYLKFMLQLLCLTGDTSYADNMERAIYNALAGAVNLERDQKNGGLPFDSYSPLIMNTRGRYIGGDQTLSDGSFYGCCACIGAAGTGLIPAISALLSEGGVVMNLYLPGTVATKTPEGRALELEIDTDYPKTGAVCIKAAVKEPETFTLSLRIPAWSRHTLLAVNGERVDVTPGKYAELTREWRTGDTVELWLDMRTEILTPPEGVELPDANSKYHVALRRGPLVLARDSRLEGDFTAPVHFAESEQGYADIREVECTAFRANAAFAVKQRDGSEVMVVDYASAGRTFDHNSLVSAWMPTEKYYETDITRPFKLRPCSRYKNNDVGSKMSAYLTLADGVLTVTDKDDSEPVFTPVPHKDGTVTLAVGDKFLAVDGEGVCRVGDKGTKLYPVYEGLDRYHFALVDGRMLHCFVNSKSRFHIAADETPTARPRELFAVVNA